MFQTRSEENGIQTYITLIEALDMARRDNTIWKISFDAFNGERIRLVKTIEGWTYENVITGDRGI